MLKILWANRIMFRLVFSRFLNLRVNLVVVKEKPARKTFFPVKRSASLHASIKEILFDGKYGESLFIYLRFIGITIQWIISL